MADDPNAAPETKPEEGNQTGPAATGITKNEETVLIEDIEDGAKIEQGDGTPAFDGYTKIYNFDPDEDSFTFDIGAAR
eukprot:CAMPEP_0185592264 /NCGR_PEP_ID=MMETSP0434-20130131/67348_1 /TAXON_ID=626734 ORGANISM="Favella taraikaensis, Strain Fe Narragansett Bay" /NCGR_SAMPLE_ID=MMETSP0434 /ASSEMBLY_ACC=CAM_ASM_000379 /LENGTH=77 /DNA_ID=CAMNT_0028217931 /DNA_START=472 /DNA_END=705 /DNA_ORIENTATION=+